MSDQALIRLDRAIKAVTFLLLLGVGLFAAAPIHGHIPVAFEKWWQIFWAGALVCMIARRPLIRHFEAEAQRKQTEQFLQRLHTPDAK